MAYQKTIVSLVILICFLFMPASNVVMAGDVPSSSRSKSAEERKIPILINELDMKGMILGDPVFIRIFKEEAQLEVWIKSGNKYSLFKSWKSVV